MFMGLSYFSNFFVYCEYKLGSFLVHFFLKEHIEIFYCIWRAPYMVNMPCKEKEKKRGVLKNGWDLTPTP